MNDTMIIQQAVLHFSGTILVTTSPDHEVRWEDTTGNIFSMKGGMQYIARSSPYPGKGCVDYTLTTLDPFEVIQEKLIIQLDTWRIIKDLSLEELEAIKQDNIAVLTKHVIDLWITIKKGLVE